MSEKQIHERMLAEIDDKFDKYDGGFTHEVTRAIAIVIDEQRRKSDETLRKIDVENLEGEELIRFVYQHTGVEHKVATFASNQVILVGTPFQEVPIGSLVAADVIFYETTEQVTLNDLGRAIVSVTCQQSGPIGNVPVGAINTFPVTLSGVTSVTNERAFTNGYAAESWDDLRKRYYDKLQRPGKAGNPNHYREWALSVVGVGKVKVYPLWNGPLTVKVVVVDANIEIPSTELLETVETYIKTQYPVGAILTVSPAASIAINVSVDITVNAGLSVEDVRDTLEAKISDYLKSLAFEADYVSRAQLGRIILETEGIADYVDLTINSGTSNITIPDATIPVLGTVTLL